MKRSILFAAVIVALFATTACRSFKTLSNTRTSQGAPYELLVVAQGPEWEGKVGQALRTLLEQPVEMTNQCEPMFNVLRVAVSDFKNMLVAHRNILKVIVSPSLDHTSALVQYDIDAAPQIVMTLQGPSQESLIEYLSTNGDKVLYAFEKAERDRTIAFAERHNVKELNDLLAAKFDMSMKVPAGYTLRTAGDDFVWASYEFPTASQGFFIYSYPFKGIEQLSVENLVRARNKFAHRIPGPSDGSYMSTVTRLPDAEGKEYLPFMPERTARRIGDRKWVELRGLWDVEGDFMGGPFVSFTTIDTRHSRIVTIDCYVYSPKLPKRNFLRSLEHLVFLADFPEVEAAVVTTK